MNKYETNQILLHEETDAIVIAQEYGETNLNCVILDTVDTSKIGTTEDYPEDSLKSFLKVGNYIKRATDILEVIQITLNEGEALVKCENGETYSLGDFDLWSPKQGDWCWFFNANNEDPILRQFEKMRQEKFKVKDALEFFDECEPHIGKLPYNYRKEG